MTVKEKDARYIAGTYARFPVTLVRGSGAELFDDGGRRYIDMGSGIGVNIFGARTRPTSTSPSPASAWRKSSP